MNHSPKHINLQFEIGDYVDAFGQPGRIIDILKSEMTDRIIVCVQFARNIVNSREFDMVDATPDKTRGVETWTKQTPAEFVSLLQVKANKINEEIECIEAT